MQKKTSGAAGSKTDYFRNKLTDIDKKHETQRTEQAKTMGKSAYTPKADMMTKNFLAAQRARKKFKENIEKDKLPKVAPPPPPPPPQPSQVPAHHHHRAGPKDRAKPLSLTKMDFELLKEWKWKEREERLESWRDVLGLPKHHRRIRIHREKVEGRDHGGEDEYATQEGIVRREVEDITGHRVLTKQDTYQMKPEMEEDTQSQVPIPDNKGLPSAMKKPEARKSWAELKAEHQSAIMFRRLSKDVQREKQLNKIGKQLEMVADKARAAELAKTFGKGWGGHVAKNKKASLTSKMSEMSHHSHHDHHDLDHHHHHHEIEPEHPHHHHHQETDPEHPHHHHLHHHHHHHHHTDVEEQQPDTSYTSTAPATPYDPEPLKLENFFKEIRGRKGKKGGKDKEHEKKHGDHGHDHDHDQARASKDLAGPSSSSRKSMEESEKGSPHSSTSSIGRFKRPKTPVEGGGVNMSVKGLTFVDRSAVEPMAKKNLDQEFYLSFNDTDLGLGLGKTQQMKIKFVKAKSLAQKTEEELEEDKKKLKINREAGSEQQEEAIPQAIKEDVDDFPVIVSKFEELPNLLKLTPEERKEYAEKLEKFEKALLELPDVGRGWKMEVTTSSKQPPSSNRGSTSKKQPRRNMFTRPSERVWYTPIPLTVKKYYRTNWKKIRHDVRKQMREWNFWPKLWINFEESHPKQMYELMLAKMAVKHFDRYGYKRPFDWKKGYHPDYIDWVLEDIVPHQGKYYYKKDNDDDELEPVRRASLEDGDIKLKDWFVKPPRYIPQSPVSPPFDQFDFCGYGDRERPYFLHFTLPREILHYYAPPSDIEKFFRTVPKPPYAFPGYTFKRWLKYPLDQKLPQYKPFPKRFSFWTRGKIGDVIQCMNTEFRIDDPLMNRRKWVYNPYHDPHTRKYVLRRDILDKLWTLGLVNSRGEVKCTLKEFNENRLYLRFNEWMEECLRRWYSRWDDRDRHNHLTKRINIDDLGWEAKSLKWQMKLERCRENVQVKDQEKYERLQMMQQKKAEQVQRAQARKELRMLELMEEAENKKKNNLRRRKVAYNLQKTREKLIKSIHNTRLGRAEEQRRIYYLEAIARKMDRQRERFYRHLEFHQRQVQEVKYMQDVLELDKAERTKRHRDKYPIIWRNIPNVIEKRKARQARVQYLERKYGMIWLRKMRKNMNRIPEEKHLSLWTHGLNEHHLERTVKYLRYESGHHHMNDLVFTLMHQIRNSLMEEEEEGEVESLREEFEVGEGETDEDYKEIDDFDKSYLSGYEEDDEGYQQDDEEKSLAESIVSGYEADEDEYE